MTGVFYWTFHTSRMSLSCGRNPSWVSFHFLSYTPASSTFVRMAAVFPAQVGRMRGKACFIGGDAATIHKCEREEKKRGQQEGRKRTRYKRSSSPSSSFPLLESPFLFDLQRSKGDELYFSFYIFRKEKLILDFLMRTYLIRWRIQRFFVCWFSTPIACMLFLKRSFDNFERLVFISLSPNVNQFSFSFCLFEVSKVR